MRCLHAILLTSAAITFLPLTPPGVVGAERLNPYSGASLDSSELIGVPICFDSTAFLVSMRNVESSHGFVISLLRVSKHRPVISAYYMPCHVATYALCDLSQVPTMRHCPGLCDTFRCRPSEIRK